MRCHRAQTQWNDALIIKRFFFEFVNNYLVLFYIAYLEPFFFSSGRRSQMPALAFQMMVTRHTCNQLPLLILPRPKR